MCEPTTIALAATAASTVVGAYTTYQSGQFNEAVGKQNATLARKLADDAITRGKEQEKLQRMRTSQLEGAQIARMGASGLAVDSGSFLELLGDTAAMGEIEALTIRANAEREAHGLRAQGANYAAGAKLAAYEGTTGAVGTLLTGAGQFASQWSKLPKSPKPTGGVAGPRNYSAKVGMFGGV